MAGGYVHTLDGEEGEDQMLADLQAQLDSLRGSSRVKQAILRGDVTIWQDSNGNQVLLISGASKLLDVDMTTIEIDGTGAVRLRSTGAALTLSGVTIAIVGPTTVAGNVQVNGVLQATGNIGTDADLIVGDDLTVTDDAVIGDSLRVNGNVGFYNTAPQSKPTVSGSRGGNAALASLLTALANLGLITNSTSA